MKYFSLKYISFLLIVIVILLLFFYTFFEFEINLNNNKFTVKLKIKLLFKLIRLNINLYPSKKKNKDKNTLKNLIILKGELKNIIKLIDKMKLIEVYSDIYFNNKNPYITIYINALIQAIYGNIINILNCENIYLKVTPKFTENNIKWNIKIEIKLRFIMIYEGILIFIRIMKLKSKNKEGKLSDSN